MKVHLDVNVLEAALARIRRLFDEFPLVVVNISGGKDSTVVLELAMKVAEERGRLPLHVLWIDQEAEWQAVADYVKGVMYDPRVKPLWLQVPFRINNSSSGTAPWLHAWEPGAKWIRDKDPVAIKENTFGADLFHGLFGAASRALFGDQLRCHLSGVRAEESPARMAGLTTYATFKDITWGSKADAGHGMYTFHPLYDWRLADVWKAIHDHGWRYCEVYDRMYQYGVPVHKMRVSNVHHETAMYVLRFLQELEPATWNKLLERIPSLNAVGHVGESYRPPKELPWMFSSWTEYRDHLLDNLIVDPDMRAGFRAQFARWDGKFLPDAERQLLQMQIAAILVHDFEGTKFKSFVASHSHRLRNRYAKGRAS